ncbi:hypothetical protein [Vibrio maritimus]|uniref:hypothetical protein n=1 Tax=Vibrio maritimus TaxID=990268 RepID=UPI00373503D1
MEIEYQSTVEDSQLVKWLTTKLSHLSEEELTQSEDADTLSRSDVFQLSSLISDYFSQENIAHNEKNYSIVYGLITGYKADQSLSRQDMLEYLVSCVFLFQN